MDSTSVICNIFNMGFKHSEAYASELRWSQNRNAAVTLLPSGFCAAVVLGVGLPPEVVGHITIGCGFPSSTGASLSKARTGIFRCLNLKRSSAKLVLPSSPRGGKCRGAGTEW